MGTTSTKLISQPQLRKIYVEARNAGVSDKFLHDVIYKMHGKESLKDLLMSEAAMLIDALIDDQSGPVNRPGMMTEKQGWLLSDYLEKLEWTDEQIQGFIKKYAHVDHFTWLSKEAASKLIEAVKNIYTRQAKKRLGESSNV